MRRAEYRLRIGENYTPEQLVFVDESACDRRTYLRNQAWALEGLRACRKQYFARGKRFVVLYITHFLMLIGDSRYSILPAITLNDGIIECMIVEGSFNGDLFASFISDLVLKMQPFPAPNSVVVMDNCAIHKVPGIRDIVESRCVVISSH